MTATPKTVAGRRTALVLGAALAVIAPATTPVASAARAPADAGVRRALAIDVAAAPSPVRASDGRRHLVYEIVVDNGTRSRVRLDRLEVRDPSRRRVLAAYRGDAVERLMAGLQGPLTRAFAPGEGDVLLLDVRLPASGRLPARLEHRFVLSRRGGGARRRSSTVTGARTRVDLREPIRVGAPLRGADLAVIGCCSSTGAHRRAPLERDGRLLFAQRYAIDFVRLGDPLSTFAGDPSRNESYFAYGAEVIAAAPGRVVATGDGRPENTPPDTAPGVTLDGAAGNFVTQDLGGGRFALYAHLQPGSVRVGPGDRVERGQVLGLVGNSGNSTEPHLHFHVMDGPGGPSNLEADGLPYVFDRLGLDGRLTGLDQTARPPARVPARPPLERTGEYPLAGDVVAFP